MPLELPGEPVSGDSGDCWVNNVKLEVTKWTGRERAESLETTNKGTNGYRTRKGGLLDMVGTVNCQWKIYKNPGSIPTIHAGMRVLLKLEIEQQGPFYEFYALISELPIENPVNGLVTWEFNYESTGNIVLPAELASSSDHDDEIIGEDG